jgi:hypothetical protein
VPSLEQIIRPFVVDPTTPPVPYVTTSNQPPPDPVTLSIGIGGTSLSDLAQSNPNVAPIQPPPTPPPTATTKTTPPAISYKTLSSSHSLSATWYMQGVVKEKGAKAAAADDPANIFGGQSPDMFAGGTFAGGGDPFAKGTTFF